VRLAVIHRYGDLQVGEVAVAIAASAPHRAQAFDACREAIERIKRALPVWKKEHGPDGAVWVGAGS
jgi:molybdopterin synthase catalytic subunit